MKAKEMGRVRGLPAGGYVAMITRYANGRKRSASRVIIADGVYPFETADHALRALNRWKNDPASITPIAIADLEPLPERFVASKATRAAAAPRLSRGTSAFRPETQHLSPAEKRVLNPSLREGDPIVAQALANGTVRITKCPEMERTNLNPRRGGITPSHLDPRHLVAGQETSRSV